MSFSLLLWILLFWNDCGTTWSKYEHNECRCHCDINIYIYLLDGTFDLRNHLTDRHLTERELEIDDIQKCPILWPKRRKVVNFWTRISLISRRTSLSDWTVATPTNRMNPRPVYRTSGSPLLTQTIQLQMWLLIEWLSDRNRAQSAQAEIRMPEYEAIHSEDGSIIINDQLKVRHHYLLSVSGFTVLAMVREEGSTWYVIIPLLLSMNRVEMVLTAVWHLTRIYQSHFIKHIHKSLIQLMLLLLLLNTKYILYGWQIIDMNLINKDCGYHTKHMFKREFAKNVYSLMLCIMDMITKI